MTDEGTALSLTASVDGAPTIDVLVVPRATGQAWLQEYTPELPTPPPGPPMLDETVTTGALWRRTLRVPKGEYFVVFDNTATAGHSALPGNRWRRWAALVSYAVKVGNPREGQLAATTLAPLRRAG